MSQIFRWSVTAIVIVCSWSPQVRSQEISPDIDQTKPATGISLAKLEVQVQSPLDSMATQAPRFETAHEAFLNAVMCIRRRDWSSFVKCFERHAHEELAFQLVARFAIGDALAAADRDKPLLEQVGRIQNRVDDNLVTLCSRWIPKARLEAGEPLGIRPEETSVHNFSDLQIVVQQQALFQKGTDATLPAKERAAARKKFVGAFPNHSQLIGTLSEMITFQTQKRQFPLPVSGALASWDADDDHIRAALPDGRGGEAGYVELSRTEQGWALTKMSIPDYSEHLAELKKFQQSNEN